MVASGILRFMCPVPSETAEHVPWLSGLYRIQKPAEMDQMWTKLVHAQPDGTHANQAASGQRPSMLNMTTALTPPRRPTIPDVQPGIVVMQPTCEGFYGPP